MKCEKSGNHTISYQSPLLNDTTVLNFMLNKMKKDISILTMAILHKQRPLDWSTVLLGMYLFICTRSFKITEVCQTINTRAFRTNWHNKDDIRSLMVLVQR